MSVTVHQFEYTLPKKFIAHSPTQPRDHAKLMVVNRKTETISHQIFKDLSTLLLPTDVLVLNQSKVFPARIYGQKSTGGRVKLLLLQPLSTFVWEAIGKGNYAIGNKIEFGADFYGKVITPRDEDSVFRIQFNQPLTYGSIRLKRLGKTPLPPYIKGNLSEAVARREYQTVFAKTNGSAAAPTAGLHFTRDLLQGIEARGIATVFITLHVGWGTFSKLREEQITTKKLHQEFFYISPQSSRTITQAKREGRRIISVGTTTLRALETAASINKGKLHLKSGWQATKLFIYPPYKTKCVDSLITNFHVPGSSLLLLVSALVSYPNTHHHFTCYGKSLIGKAYTVAQENNYRFFSFGDAMWIQ